MSDMNSISSQKLHVLFTHMNAQARKFLQIPRKLWKKCVQSEGVDFTNILQVAFALN